MVVSRCDQRGTNKQPHRLHSQYIHYMVHMEMEYKVIDVIL